MALATKVYEQVQKEQAAKAQEETKEDKKEDKKSDDVADAEFEEK